MPAHLFAHCTTLLQLLVAEPHASAAHGSSGVQPQAFAPTAPPPHVFGDLHVLGQVIDCPQLLVAEPQALPRHASTLSGTHSHFVTADPSQVSEAPQAMQLLGSPQPLFRSKGTHLLPHFLVPGPQLPTTQAPASQTSVPVPGDSQPLSSQVVVPQPYVGSSTATH